MIETAEELEEALSRPSSADVAAMAALEGDLLLLGVGGKMGPSLARLARRACFAAGVEKRIIGVARFTAPGLAESLQRSGIETISGDLLSPGFLGALPETPNVIFMAGRKFRSAGRESLTWAMNTYLPARVAERFPRSRMVAFSSGNVYPLTSPASGGPSESYLTGPLGEYAQSCLGRERMFQYFSEKQGTRCALLRLNYAIELRYGVLRDVAEKVWRREPLDLTMGWVNVIWQRDANAVALRALEHCASPPLVVNVTGTKAVSVRDIAERFAEAFGVRARYTETGGETALLSNAERMRELFGEPPVTLEEMIASVAEWVRAGGASLGKPTHFEEREGRF